MPILQVPTVKNILLKHGSFRGFFDEHAADIICFQVILDYAVGGLQSNSFFAMAVRENFERFCTCISRFVLHSEGDQIDGGEID